MTVINCVYAVFDKMSNAYFGKISKINLNYTKMNKYYFDNPSNI